MKNLYAVINVKTGEYAGVPCESLEEARELAAQDDDREIFMLKPVHFCPVNGWDCPYWKKDGTCKLDDPMADCDDYYAMMGDDEE